MSISISRSGMFISNTIKPFSGNVLCIKLFQNKVGKRLLFKLFLVLFSKNAERCKIGDKSLRLFGNLDIGISTSALALVSSLAFKYTNINSFFSEEHYYREFILKG